MQSFRIIVYCTPFVYCTIADVTHIFMTSPISSMSLDIQYHYASMQMNAMPIDSMSRNEKKHKSDVNEIENFIEVYHNLVY